MVDYFMNHTFVGRGNSCASTYSFIPYYLLVHAKYGHTRTLNSITYKVYTVAYSILYANNKKEVAV